MKKESIIVSAISFAVFLISIVSAQESLSQEQIYSNVLLLTLFVMLAIIILAIILITVFKKRKKNKK